MTDTLTAQVDAGPRPRRRGWRAAAVVAAIGAALSLGVAGPAQASVSSYYGGTGSASFSCGANGMYSDITISPQRGFTWSQNVRYRLYVKDLTNGAYQGWTGYTYFTAYDRQMSWRYPPQHAYQIYIEYGWLNGAGWSVAGEWIQTYVHRVGGQGTPTYLSYCQEY